jgi:hypothetical protein
MIPQARVFLDSFLSFTQTIPSCGKELRLSRVPPQIN